MGSVGQGSGFFASRPKESARRSRGDVPSTIARAILESAVFPITLGGSSEQRATRLERAKARWIAARPGREILLMTGGPRAGNPENWVAVFVEDGKGLVSVRADTEEDALERGLALLKPKSGDKNR